MKKLFIFLSLVCFNSFVFSNTDFKAKYLEIVSPDIEHPAISRDTKQRIVSLLSTYKIPGIIAKAVLLLEKFDNGDKDCISELVLNFETLANIIPSEDDLLGTTNSLTMYLKELEENKIYFGNFLEFYYSWYEVAGLQPK